MQFVTLMKKFNRHGAIIGPSCVLFRYFAENNSVQQLIGTNIINCSNYNCVSMYDDFSFTLRPCLTFFSVSSCGLTNGRKDVVITPS